MKFKLIRIFTILFIPLLSEAQLNNPGVHWKQETWSQLKYDLSTPQSQGESGDEWWYWHTNIYDPNTGEHIGYAAAGYVSWVNEFYNEAGGVYSSGCHVNTSAEHNPILDRFEFYAADHQPTFSYVGTFWSAIARFDLNGKMVWSKRFAQGEFRDIIQDEDGSLLAIGYTQSTIYKDSYGNETNLICNPGASRFNVECKTTDSDKAIKKIYLVRTDLNGDLLDNFCYGYYDNQNQPSGWDLNDLESSGHGIVEVSPTNTQISGKYFITGVYADVTGTPLGKGLIILLDGNLEVVRKSVYGNSDGTEFHSVQKYVSGSTEHYAFGGLQKVYDPSQTYMEFQPYIVVLDENGVERFSPIVHTDPRSGQFKRSRVTSVSFSKYGEIYLSALFQNSNFYDFDSYIYKLDPNSGLTTGWTATGISNPFYIAHTQTYDNQLGISPPESNDEEFAIVTSIKSNNLHSDIYSSLRVPSLHTLASYWGTSTSPGVAFHDLEYVIRRTEDANGYVAKFTDIPSNNKPILEWDVEFDIDDSPTSRDYWPGDIKKQECLYSITKNDDNGYTVAGNCSENFDDGYIVKIAGDCGMELTYDIGNSETEYVISTSTNEVWNSDRIIRGIIRIQNSATLTINNSLIEFADSKTSGMETHIVVENGGLLTINNSTLTSDPRCELSPWDGIKILGDPNESHNTLDQGKVVLSNCTISNARYALVMGEVQYDDILSWIPTQTHGGGIINANDAVFLNNRRSVHFAPYDYSISNPGTNSSYFEDCDFINNQSLPGAFETGSLYYISLLYIQDIDILGCYFSGDYTYSLSSGPNTTAISGFDCGFFMKPSNSGSTLIEKMEYGINVQNTLFSDYPVDIISAEFNDNLHGIFMKNYHFPKIALNTFMVGFNGAVNPYGIYLLDCQRYALELNQLENNALQSISYGAIINNKSDEDFKNLVYDNIFRDFWIGLAGYDENRGLNLNTGLKIFCNDFEGNEYDIHADVGQGVSELQGIWYPGGGSGPDSYLPPNNCFDDCQVSEGKFNNDANWSILYVEDLSGPSCEILSSDPNCYDPLMVLFVNGADILDNSCDDYQYGNDRPARLGQNKGKEFTNIISQQSLFDKNSQEFKNLEIQKNNTLNIIISDALRENRSRVEEVIELLRTTNSDHQKLELVNLLSRINRYDEAIELISEIKGQKFQLYIDFKKKLINEIKKGKSIYNLDNNELKIAALNLLVSDSIFGYNSAKAYLSLIDDEYKIEEEFAEPDAYNSVENIPVYKSTSNIFIEAYPNPFNKSVQIEVFLPNGTLNSSIEFININGNIVGSKILKTGENKFQFGSDELESGFYIGVVKNDNNIVKTFKVIKN